MVLSLIGAFYYLRIVKLMYFDEPTGTPIAVQARTSFRVALSANGLALLVFGILPQPLMALCLRRDPRALKDLTEHFVAGELVFDGNLLKVYRDTVRLPDGSQGEREYIRHPGAVAIVALTEDRRLLLERQYRYPPRREFIEMPAGKIEPRRGAPRHRQARAAGGDRLRGRRSGPACACSTPRSATPTRRSSSTSRAS